MSKDFDISRRPNIIPWPPIILGLSLLSGIALSIFLPVRQYFGHGLDLFNGPGIGLLLSGIFLDIWALQTMFSRKTNIRPHYGADKLVTSGPFAYTRNPIYLGNTITIFAIGLAFSHPWFLVMSVMHAVAIYALAIRREEVHLEAKFGSEWSAYRNKVPRWLWVI